MRLYPATRGRVLRPIAIAALLLSPSPGAATIFGRDDRVTGRNSELEAVGIVTGGSGVHYGSGFLIADCTMLSARHVVGPSAEAVGLRLKFRSGLVASKGTVIAAGPYQEAGSPARVLALDWIIVRLDRCLGRKLGVLRLTTVSPTNGGPEWRLAAAGFPYDRRLAAGVTLDPDCRIARLARGEIAHDCATLPGNSGGPILVRDASGIAAIGINVAGYDRIAPTFDPADANIAVEVAALARHVCPLIDARNTPPFCSVSRRSDIASALTPFILESIAVLPDR